MDKVGVLLPVSLGCEIWGALTILMFNNTNNPHVQNLRWMVVIEVRRARLAPTSTTLAPSRLPYVKKRAELRV